MRPRRARWAGSRQNSSPVMRTSPNSPISPGDGPTGCTAAVLRRALCFKIWQSRKIDDDQSRYSLYFNAKLITNGGQLQPSPALHRAYRQHWLVCCDAHSMSLMGQKRTIHGGPKSTVVYYCPKAVSYTHLTLPT